MSNRVLLSNKSIANFNKNIVTIEQFKHQYTFSVDDLRTLLGSEEIWSEPQKVRGTFIGSRLNKYILDSDDILYMDSDIQGKIILIANDLTEVGNSKLLLFTLRMGDKLTKPLELSKNDLQRIVNR